MAIFLMRFDLRNPAIAGTTMGERYAAALEMAEWADRLGFYSIVLSEHHGSDDGYLPSALTMAAAVAARTERIQIQLAALVSSLHDPLRLAEEAAVVDLISSGRLEVVLANGYVPDEFAMFDAPLSGRAARTTEVVQTLRDAWTGEPFSYRGRTVRVTPAPHRPGGPKLWLGGSSPGAARRAARLDVGFMPSVPAVWEPYRAEVIAQGRLDPGEFLGADTSFTYVANDVDAAWAAIAPYALHEANAYGAWAAAAGIEGSTGYAPAVDADALRATGQHRVCTPDELAAELIAAGPFAIALFHPMMGGIPPTLAWESLNLFEQVVLPRI